MSGYASDTRASSSWSQINKEDRLEQPNNTWATEEKEEKQQKIREEISSFIIESYKAQWDKIVRDIETTLQKNVPDRAERMRAYERIQLSLEARKKMNRSSSKMSDTNKEIIDIFLSYMIDSIEKKKEEIK